MLKLITKLNVAIILVAGMLYLAIPDRVQISEPPHGTTLPSPSRMDVASNKVNESIIRLNSPDGYFFCSGFVIAPQYAMTAAHCVVNDFGRISDQQIIIQNSKGGNTGTVAQAVALDNYRDVAIIFGDFTKFQIQSTDFYGADVWIGMEMRSCGFPAGERKFCSDMVLVGNHYFQYRTNGVPIFKGMSGGPVINTRTGNAVGVNSAVGEDSIVIGPLVGSLSTLGF